MVKKADRPKHIVKRALELAAAGRWSSVSLRDIAEASDVSLAELHELYPSKVAIVRAHLRAIDETVLKTEFAFEADDSARDRLFDVLMRRFDALSEDREGVLSILHAMRCDPLAALCLADTFAGSMRWMLEAAGIRAAGPAGRMIVRGLCAVWLSTLRVWERDDSEDMAKTMAALDKSLRRAERLCAMLPGPRRRRAPEEPQENAAPA